MGYRLLPLLLAGGLLFWLPLLAMASPEITEQAKAFVKDYEKRLHPLDTAANLAWWTANTTGKAEDFARKEEAQNRIDAVLSDPKAFAEVKDLRSQIKEIDDPISARAIDIIYLIYLEKQVDAGLLKKMVAKSNAVEKASMSSGPRSMTRR